MRKRLILPLITGLLTLGFAILAYIILPSKVVIQFSIGSSGNTYVPKIIAVLIPFALGIGGSVMTFFARESKSKSRGLIVSFVGIVVFVMTIIVNIILK